MSHLSRRQFLLASSALGATTLIGGCGQQATLGNIEFLNKSVPPQLIRAFRRKFPDHSQLQFRPISNLQGAFKNLQNWQNPPPPTWRRSLSNQINKLPLIGKDTTTANLVSIGDRWLSEAVKKGLIQPLPRVMNIALGQLPERWQPLITLDNEGQSSSEGKQWAFPYRWGTLLMVYRKSEFQTLGWQPKQWEDLWRPELRQKIALVDSPRDVIGFTLNAMGYGANQRNPTKIPGISKKLASLQQQVKFFSNKYYLQALLNKDVSVAVGWSNEILPLLKLQPDLAASLPSEGTILWADYWVMPASIKTLGLEAIDWLGFFNKPESVKAMALFSSAAPAPMLETDRFTDLPRSYCNNSLVNLSPELRAKSDFIVPLSESSQEEYNQVWQDMRNS